MRRRRQVRELLEAGLQLVPEPEDSERRAERDSVVLERPDWDCWAPGFALSD